MRLKQFALSSDPYILHRLILGHYTCYRVNPLRGDDVYCFGYTTEPFQEKNILYKPGVWENAIQKKLEGVRKRLVIPQNAGK